MTPGSAGGEGSGARGGAAASMQNLDTLAAFGPDEDVAARERHGQANIFGETALADHETLTGDGDGSLEQDPFGPTPDAGGGGSPGAERPRTRFGRYVVLERVGAGGMGEVYAAYDPELDRKVAIKLIRPGRDTEDARARLLREAQAMARLSHPNVVAVHDVGAFGRQVFIAMEFVRGETVTAWLKATPRSWREVRDMFIQAGRGLQAAHSAGLVHRDFKPDYTRGAPKILQHPAARGFVAPGRVFGASHVSVAAA